MTGTDTDVGKTHISSSLLQGFLLSGKKVGYWKPVQSGGKNLDLDVVLTSTKGDLNHFESIYTFEEPVSPDQAARKVGVKIDLQKIFQQIPNTQPLDYLVVEGAGGLFVPLNEQGETWIDFLRLVESHVVVVSRCGLGTLNHTLLTVRALSNVSTKSSSVVLSGENHAENKKSLTRDLPSDVKLCSFPRSSFGEESHDLHCKKLVGSLNEVFSLKGDNLNDHQKNLWRPFTQHKLSPNSPRVVSAKGIWLTMEGGEKLMDGVSSWWTNSIGHAHPRIGRAIHKQQQTLDHVLFADMVHQPALELVSLLKKELHEDLSKYFFSDDGSTAVEVALKMCCQHWKQSTGKVRKRFMVLEGGYHGDTLGAMSLGKGSGFHDPYHHWMFDVDILRPKLAFEDSQNDADFHSVESIQETLTNEHDQIAGFIMEPLLQGASGMRVIDPQWQKAIVVACKEKNIPVIFDEIFTGFGRAGSMFAYQQLGVTPDIICLSKALTGGNLALSLTVATDTIFQSFYSDQKSDALLHGHSYTANPIACAAAVETLKVYREEGVLNNLSVLMQSLSKMRNNIKNYSGFYNVRQVGGVLAFEIAESTRSYNVDTAFIRELASKHQIFLRPLGNTVYVCPPFHLKPHEVSLFEEKFMMFCQSLCHYQQLQKE